MKRTCLIRTLALAAALFGLSACGLAPSAPTSQIASATVASLPAANLLGLGEPPVQFKLYDLGGQGPAVLLIHGYMGSHLDEQDFGTALLAHGYAPYTIDMTPADDSVADTAVAVARAASEIMAERQTDQIFLAGHSQGGLDSRYYLDFLGGAAHVKALVTVCTPNHGTLDAWFAHGGARADLMLNSALTKQLNAVPQPVPTLSIYSESDQIVVPYISAHLDGAENMPICCHTHTGMLHDPGVAQDIVNFFDAHR